MANEINNQLILSAHADNDHRALVEYYTKFARQCETLNQIDEACYFFTLAYVFALQEGMEEVEILHRQLKKHGREE